MTEKTYNIAQWSLIDTPPTPPTKGKEEFGKYMETILTGIPNLFHSIVSIVDEGDQIAVRALYNGRHTGKLFDFEASNNKIQYNELIFVV